MALSTNVFHLQAALTQYYLSAEKSPKKEGDTKVQRKAKKDKPKKEDEDDDEEDEDPSSNATNSYIRQPLRKWAPAMLDMAMVS